MCAIHFLFVFFFMDFSCVHESELYSKIVLATNLQFDRIQIHKKTTKRIQKLLIE